jgi:membrane associated rhomboid family serine protease
LKTAWIICNAVAVVTTLVCMSYLYYACRPAGRGRLPWASVAIIGLTLAISGLQFVEPAVLTTLRRDPDAIRAGEVWRFVTALFVQPYGVAQFAANVFLLVAFMPAVERLYGWGVLAVFFACGLAGQGMNYLWESGSGGSSTAAFGLMGCLLACILRNRRALLAPFAVIASVGLLAAVFMTAVHDGHGVGLLVGAAAGLILPLAGVSFREKTAAAATLAGTRP